LNVIFEWPDRNISSVKRHSFNENSQVIVVLFPDSLSEFSYLTQRGAIGHEIAHVHRRDFANGSTFTEREIGVEALLKEWNFKEELISIKGGNYE
jgi:hypothetical protein